MIRFLTVHGDVFVDDKRKGITQKATSGLELDETTGNYLIATTKNSSAQLYAGGKSFTLGQLSFMRIAPDGRTWWDRHWETWGYDSKILLGRIWSLIDRDPRDPEPPGNAVIGIRG
jgi:hypothetical protein